MITSFIGHRAGLGGEGFRFVWLGRLHGASEGGASAVELASVEELEPRGARTECSVNRD